MPRKKTMAYKKVLVSIPEETWTTIERELKPKIGSSDSEVIRFMVLGYLQQNGYIKPRMK